MENGWIKLYRCSLDSRVFQNEGLLKVWIWCLLKANHSTQWVSLRTGKGSIEVECKNGQFIFGRNVAAKELDMKPDTVRKRMAKLKSIENITIKSTNQYSIITIMNWDTYQLEDKKSTNQSAKQIPSKRQANTTNKNEKNENNENKISRGKTNAPESFTPSEKLLEYFNKEAYWKENSQDLIDACFDHHRSKGNKMVDWEAAIKTWCRNDKKFNPKNYDSKGGFTIEVEGGVEMEFNSMEEVKAYQAKMAVEASERTEP